MGKSKQKDLKNYLDKILGIRTFKRGKKARPHKYVLLLAIIETIEENNDHDNAFTYTELEPKFESIWKRKYSLHKCKSSHNMLEYPFFHLANDGFWHFKIKDESQNKYEYYKHSQNPKLRFTKQRILETIEYAYIDEELFELLLNSEIRSKVRNRILHFLKSGLEGRDGLIDDRDSIATDSLFEHESKAIKTIERAIKTYSLGKAVANIEIHDQQTNNYYEYDVIVVTHSGIYVTELKHWSGKIQILPYQWQINDSQYRPDPHKTNQFKAKILKGLYEHSLRTYPNIWVESVVVLTNSKAEVEGASSTKTEKHCPTFDSIENFIKYLRNREIEINAGRKRGLSDTEIEGVVNYLNSLDKPKRSLKYSIPGYKIVEHLTQKPDFIEFVARPTDGKYRNLRRFRIFLPPNELNLEEKELFQTKARNTLEAVARIGEHQNILKVWRVPDEFGAIIEGSDWSEEGTLKDIIENSDDPQEQNKVIEIAKGILNALSACHQQGVIHRAVKPENILMLNNKPRLMNFELAYHLEPGEHRTVIPDASAIKKDAYTAPEIYKGEDVDESTDLFSLGVILFEMLCKERPFKDSSSLEAKGGRLSEEHIDKLRANNVDNNVISAIEQMVRLDRKERLRTSEDVAKILKLSEIHENLSVKKPINTKLSPGEMHDVYEIIQLIGEGAKTQIYKAKTIGGKLVVLKLFDQDVPLSRIQNEEKYASIVNSSYLVRVNHHGYWKNDRHYLELDYVKGRPMRQDVDEKKTPDIETFKSITNYLMEAVECLHNRKIDGNKSPILHNDIKPDNVILTSDNKAVLTDFGIASEPKVDLFQGTEGYVAPDLNIGGELQFCESGDLFALGVTLFEWLVGQRPYETVSIDSEPIDPLNIRPDIPGPVGEWLLMAVKTKREERYASIQEMKNAFFEACTDEIKTKEDEEKTVFPKKEFVEPVVEFKPAKVEGNSFVAYLNSLHNSTSSNENALAESQALSPHFPHIHVSSGIAKYIIKKLEQENECHIILTGHAGDGKSTIGLEIYKHFNEMPKDQPLTKPLEPIELLVKKSKKMIKDMSELPLERQDAILAETCSDSSSSYFIISNTGTLLNAFKRLTSTTSDWGIFQNKLLEALESEHPETFEYKNGKYILINMARIDNIETAVAIFDKMIETERWETCKNKNCKEKCPIYRNVRILQKYQHTVRNRIKLLYRLLYEYGCRLTLRQLTAHLAYSLTAGLDHDKIKEFAQRVEPPPLRRFLFFNRFFGDLEDGSDPGGDQIRAIREIRKWEFSSHTHPFIERTLWLKKTNRDLPIFDGEIEEVFNFLRDVGSGKKISESFSAGFRARLQIRRLLYCFGSFPSEQVEKSFITTFLNSPMIIDYSQWQESGHNLAFSTRNRIERKVLHVLQEHFTGVRLPENLEKHESIYITLNRKDYRIRQSAQIVLGKFAGDDFRIKLLPVNNEIGRTCFKLVMEYEPSNILLPLDLPFLDYVNRRFVGEIAQRIQTFYVDRLEKFKVKLLSEAQQKSNDMILVRLQLNHKFKSQTFSIAGNKLEVS